MDPVIQLDPKELLGHLNEAELAELTRLLELARKNCADTPISCSGSGEKEPASCAAKG